MLMWGWSFQIQFNSQKYNILLLNRSDCIDSIVQLRLGNVYTLVTVWGDCPLPALRKALCSALPGWETFCFFEFFHTSSLFLTQQPALLSPGVATLSNGKLQVSFPCQVLQPAMLSILLSYLKNVEYQQWLSLVHCQLLYEAILAEWDGSQSRESSAAVCTTTPVTGRLPRSLYFSAAPGIAMVAFPSEWPRLESGLGLGAVDITAIFQSLVLRLGLLTASCWRCV